LLSLALDTVPCSYVKHNKSYKKINTKRFNKEKQNSVINCLKFKIFSGLVPERSQALATNLSVRLEEDESESSDDRKTENKLQLVSPFTGLISECFQPYLNIYIESLDRNLSELMAKFVQDAKIDLSREQGTVSGSTVGVLSSCADLFVFYKKCLVQCTQLSTGHPMLGLAATFQKYLGEYASKVLRNNLPKLGGSGTSLSSMTSITRDFRDLSTAAGLIQNFLKEGESVR
jgi:hypothetical protein